MLVCVVFRYVEWRAAEERFQKKKETNPLHLLLPCRVGWVLGTSAS